MFVNNNHAIETNAFVGAPLGATNLAEFIAPKGAPTNRMFL